MRLHITHRTRYTYAAPVKDSFNEVRLQPTSSGGQSCEDFLLRLGPPATLSDYRDLYQNCVHRFEVLRAHRELSITATSIVTTPDQPSGPPLDATPCALAEMAQCSRLELCHDFLQSSKFVDVSPELWRLAIDLAVDLRDAWQAALAIMRYIHREFRYEPNATHVNSHTSEVLPKRAGVCQDFAHVMIGLCRALRIPTRYVSGYLYNGPTEQLQGAQASHAWVEVYIPGSGWCGLDPTNNRPVDGHHVKVSVGRDYADAAPIRGVYTGTNERTMSVEVLVSADQPAEVR